VAAFIEEFAMHAARTRSHAAEPTAVIDSSRMIVRSVITAIEPDRIGDVVVPGGLRNRGEYLRNPVVLWAHQRTIPPIGTCLGLEVLPDRIVAETKFAAASSLARDVFRLYAEGVLRGWSIGFVPRKSHPMLRAGRFGPAGIRIEEWDLLEYSAVPVPENPQALTLAVRKGLVRDVRLRDWLMKHDVMAELL
jgi:Escherichia/Staphylococcus phage prohead protease